MKGNRHLKWFISQYAALSRPDKSSNLKLTEKYVNKINSLSVLRSELTNVIKKIYESNPLPIWNNN